MDSVSTTYGPTGALIGAGLISRSGVNFGVLGKKFCLPLLPSPVLAMVLTSGLGPLSRLVRRGLGAQGGPHHRSAAAVTHIGVLTGTARAKTIASLLLAWATALPLGAALGACAMLLFKYVS